MALERIFYATHGVSVAGPIMAGGQLKGVQSVSMTSNTNLEAVFQLGQLSHVATVPTTPEVEVTISRALVNGPALKLTIDDSDLLALEKKLMGTHTITIGVIGGAQGFTVNNAFLSSYTVNFAVDGLFTEEITFVGDSLTSGGSFNQLKDPTLVMPRRQDITGLANATSASVSVNFNRESIYRLGQFKPFLRTVTFPIDCTLQFNKLLPEGGVIKNEELRACTPYAAKEENYKINVCGNNGSWEIKKARLSNIGWSGGDTGGGNVEIAYTYSSWNNLIIG